MALVSPGTQVTVVDESQYVSSRLSTVPYILIATAENKINAAGTDIASGTLASTANDVQLVTSQRELVTLYGNPTFYKTSGGNSINGYELNEYGLMAAYSVLGATNRAYIQRVDIDLAELTATNVRPTGNPLNSALWLDLNQTQWGLFVWNSVTNSFNVQAPLNITNTADLFTGTSVPLDSIGTVGSYAIVTTNANNPIYYKNSSNVWVLVGSDAWKSSIPTVTGTATFPTITAGDTIVINGTSIAAPDTTLNGLVNAINAAGITGITASATNNRIAFYVESVAGSGTSSVDVTVSITAGAVVTGLGVLSEVGVVPGTYAAPIVTHASHTAIPRWRGTDLTPRPNGSIWVKTTSVNQGASITMKQYDTPSDSFIVQDVPVYENDETANKWLDPGLGGRGIVSGAMYAQYDVNKNGTGTFKVFTRTPGATEITGLVSNPSFTVGHQYEISVSDINNVAMGLPTQITIQPTATSPLAGDVVTATDFVTDLLSANIPYVNATVTTTGNVQISHTAGGVIILADTAGSAIAATGISSAIENVRDSFARPANTPELILSNWNVAEYTADIVEPGQDPLDGTRWFYGALNDIDILIQDDGAWRGYRTVNNDVRGHDLTTTNSAGPMLSAVEPTSQDDGTPLVFGDLWIDSSDLENYPRIYRWDTVNQIPQWVLLDSADQTSTEGVLFADARWGTNDNIDPISDDLPLITDMAISNYVDIDAPNPDLYPPGMLLWNTRRSGNTVKEFRVNYFNANSFNNILPAQKNAWVTISGNKADGRANMGRQAQRALVVSAMKAAIDTSDYVREEQRQFNVLAAPGYPELIANMVALNNERANTGFVIGDTPLRLANTGNELTNWASNNSGLGTLTADGLTTSDEYLSVFYPSGLTTDLTGTNIVVPASHMMLRTIIHSDDQSYPWFAPAGTRRGVVDNVSALGFIDSATNEFTQIAVRQGIRDILYPLNVNPIAFLPGGGIVNYGNKTTSPASALDRINVSRLISYLRVQLDAAAKPYLFEPNDELTRNEIKGSINQIMADLIAKRAIYDYIVVCDSSNNTPFRIDRNELWVDVAIEPTKAAEFIFVPLRIKNTGEIKGLQ